MIPLAGTFIASMIRLARTVKLVICRHELATLASIGIVGAGRGVLRHWAGVVHHGSHVDAQVENKRPRNYR